MILNTVIRDTTIFFDSQKGANPSTTLYLSIVKIALLAAKSDIAGIVRRLGCSTGAVTN